MQVFVEVRRTQKGLLLGFSMFSSGGVKGNWEIKFLNIELMPHSFAMTCCPKKRKNKCDAFDGIPNLETFIFSSLLS